MIRPGPLDSALTQAETGGRKHTGIALILVDFFDTGLRPLLQHILSDWTMVPVAIVQRRPQ